MRYFSPIFFLFIIFTSSVGAIVNDRMSLVDSIALRFYCRVGIVFNLDIKQCVLNDAEKFIFNVANGGRVASVNVSQSPLPIQIIQQTIQKLIEVPVETATYIPGPAGPQGQKGDSGVAGINGINASVSTPNNVPFLIGLGTSVGSTGATGPAGANGISGTTTLLYSIATSTGDINATGTITSFNFIGTNATTTNATTTNLFSSLITALSGFFTNLVATNATTTNLFSTNANFDNFIFGNATGTNISILNDLTVTGTTTLSTTTFSVLPNIPLAFGNLLVGNVSNIASAFSPGATGTVLQIINGTPTWVATSSLGVASEITNTASTTDNIITSTVNGIVATTTSITSNVLTSLANTLTATVNGIASVAANIINSFTQSLTGNVLTTTINGVEATSTVISNNTISFATGTGILTSDVNGVTSTTTLSLADLPGLVNLTSQISGVLPVINGGTGTSTAPSLGQLLVGDGLGGYNLVATSSLGISSLPGGSDTQIQFNDGGAFGGDAQFAFNKTSGLTTITGASADGSALAKFAAGSGASFTQINNNGTVVIDSDVVTGTFPLSVKYNGATVANINFAGTGDFVKLVTGVGNAQAINIASGFGSIDKTATSIDLSATFSNNLRLFTTNTANHVLLQSSGGNVGIGTLSPANKLSVNGITTADALAQVAIGTNATTNKGLVVQGVAGQTASIMEVQGSDGFGLEFLPTIIRSRSNAAISFNNPFNGDISFGSGGGPSKETTIDHNGNKITSISGRVIGWTSSATDSTVAADTGFSRISAGVIGVGTGTAGSFAGNLIANVIGIGTTTPLAKLDILDTALAGSGSLAGSILNLAQTWNTTGTPTALKLNVTNTASNAASLLTDLQVGGVSRFNVNNAGVTTFGPIQGQAAGGVRVVIDGEYIKSYYSTEGTPRVTLDMPSKLFITTNSNAVDLYGSADQTYGASLISNSQLTLFVKPSDKSTPGGYTGAGHLLKLQGGVASITGVGGAGGSAYLTGGYAAGTGDNNGGDVYIDGGLPTGAGTNGNILLGTTRGNVGIGTTTPSQLLTVGNNNQFTVSSTGAVTLGSVTSGQTALTIPNGNNASYNFVIRRNAETSASWELSTSNSNFGALAIHAGNHQITSENASSLAFSATAAIGDVGISRFSANVLAVGNGTAGDVSGTLIAGNVGVGTTTPATKLQVFGDVRVGDSGTNGCVQRFDGAALAGTCTSDRNLKKDVIYLDNILEKVTDLKPSTYSWNDTAVSKYKYTTDTSITGLIAQDVETVFPHLVSVNSDGYKVVDSQPLVYYTLEAIRELNTKLGDLSNENSDSTQFSVSLIWKKISLTFESLGIKIAQGLVTFKDVVVEKFSAKEVKTEMLCVGETCVTETEFVRLLQNAGVAGVNTPVVENQETLDPILTNENPNPTNEVATTTTNTATTTASTTEIVLPTPLTEIVVEPVVEDTDPVVTEEIAPAVSEVVVTQEPVATVAPSAEVVN